MAEIKIMPKQLALVEASAPMAKPKRRGSRKKAPDCQDCHRFLRVDGEPACTHIPQKEGRLPYKFLKSLKPCGELWRVK